MRTIEECFRFQGEIKRLTKANSVIIGGRAVYIAKKNHLNKAIKYFSAFDYKTKVLLSVNLTKEDLISNLRDRMNSESYIELERAVDNPSIVYETIEKQDKAKTFTDKMYKEPSYSRSGSYAHLNKD